MKRYYRFRTVTPDGDIVRRVSWDMETDTLQISYGYQAMEQHLMYPVDFPYSEVTCPLFYLRLWIKNGDSIMAGWGD